MEEKNNKAINDEELESVSGGYEHAGYTYNEGEDVSMTYWCRDCQDYTHWKVGPQAADGRQTYICKTCGGNHWEFRIFVPVNS